MVYGDSEDYPTNVDSNHVWYFNRLAQKYD